ncbi:MAG: sulfatase, partial [Planctomycetota bacterium]
VRDGRWKLLAYRSGKTALYDVEHDISEQHDVAARHPEIVERLVESLKAWEREMGVEAYSGVQ